MKQSNPNHRKRQGGIIYTFPQKLQTLLDETTDESIVGWNVEGDGFVIRDLKAFSTLLSKYFRTSKLPSFQRQLNAYGFLRDNRKADGKTPDDHHVYYHKEFSRANPAQAKGIRRIGAHQNRVGHIHTSMHNNICSTSNPSSHSSDAKILVADSKAKSSTKQYATLQQPNIESSNPKQPSRTSSEASSPRQSPSHVQSKANDSNASRSNVQQQHVDTDNYYKQKTQSIRSAMMEPRDFLSNQIHQLPSYFQSKLTDGNASHSIAQRNLGASQQHHMDTDSIRSAMMDRKDFLPNQYHQEGHPAHANSTLYSVLPLPPSAQQLQPLPWSTFSATPQFLPPTAQQHLQPLPWSMVQPLQHQTHGAQHQPLPWSMVQPSSPIDYWSSSQSSIAPFFDDSDLDDAVAAIRTRGLKAGKDNVILNWNTDKEARLTFSGSSSESSWNKKTGSAQESSSSSSSESSSSDEDRDFSRRRKEPVVTQQQVSSSDPSSGKDQDFSTRMMDSVVTQGSSSESSSSSDKYRQFSTRIKESMVSQQGPSSELSSSDEDRDYSRKRKEPTTVTQKESSSDESSFYHDQQFSRRRKESVLKQQASSLSSSSEKDRQFSKRRRKSMVTQQGLPSESSSSSSDEGRRFSTRVNDPVVTQGSSSESSKNTDKEARLGSSTDTSSSDDDREFSTRMKDLEPTHTTCPHQNRRRMLIRK